MPPTVPHDRSHAASSYRKYADFTFLDSLYRINVQPQELGESENFDQPIASFYDRLADGASSNQFWNWGCDDEALSALVSEHLRDDSDGFSEQLYALACVEPIRRSAAGSRIVDIGCGAGQGTMLLARMYPHLEFTGLDLSRGAIDAAEREKHAPNVAFVNASFTELGRVVRAPSHAICVESAHNYPSLSQLLRSVAEALPVGGTLSAVDFFTTPRRRELEELLADDRSWMCEQDNDISTEVKRSISQRVEAIRKQARSSESGIFRRYFESRGREIMIGSQFLDRRDSLVGHLVRLANRGRVMKLDSYRHIVLRRIGD